MDGGKVSNEESRVDRASQHPGYTFWAKEEPEAALSPSLPLGVVLLWQQRLCRHLWFGMCRAQFREHCLQHFPQGLLGCHSVHTQWTSRVKQVLRTLAVTGMGSWIWIPPACCIL